MKKISIHALLTESDQTAAENAQDAAISIHALLTESDQAGDGGDCCRRNFNPRSPHGERRVASGSSRSCHDDFNPRSPHGERRPVRYGGSAGSPDFNPRSPHGERPAWGSPSKSVQTFQSTLSSRRATRILRVPFSLSNIFQSTLSSRRATSQLDNFLIGFLISIHALLTESDVGCYQSGSIVIVNFNPRSPHGERRNRLAVPLIHGLISIHALLTESDVRIVDHLFGQRDFNPRSPHGERPSTSSRSGADISISIHALLTESDAHSATREITCEKFQSTLSSRRATLPRNTVLSWMNYFNPRSPHGERPDTLSSSRVEKKFQSTLSSRRATAWLFGGRTGRSISIHALLTESDSTRSAMPLTTDYFNPRSPHGERQAMANSILAAVQFQSTLSSRRATTNFH